jgi:hypothetical protein
MCVHSCFTFKPWVPNPLSKYLICAFIVVYKHGFGLLKTRKT